MVNFLSGCVFYLGFFVLGVIQFVLIPMVQTTSKICVFIFVDLRDIIFDESAKIIGYVGLTIYLVYFVGVKFSLLNRYYYQLIDREWESVELVLQKLCGELDISLPRPIFYLASCGLKVSLDYLVQKKVVNYKVASLYRFKGELVKPVDLPDPSYQTNPIIVYEYKRVGGSKLDITELVLQF